MKKVVLYLDIDGVLNSFYDTSKYGSLKSGQSEYNRLKNCIPRSDVVDFQIPNSLCDHLVNLELNKLFALRIFIRCFHITDIIICSSWRAIYTPEEMKLLFYMKGFPDIAELITGETTSSKQDIEKMKSKTGYNSGKDNDILLHIEKNKIKEYFILDDDVCNLNIWKEEKLVLPILRYLEEEVVLKEGLDRMYKAGGDLHDMNPIFAMKRIHNYKHDNGLTYTEATKKYYGER